MKITLSPDSFKGSLSAQQVSDVMSEAVHSIMPNADCAQLPMADGGEGTIDALVHATKGKRVNVLITGPLGERINTVMGFDGYTNEAILEVASVCGIDQVEKSNRNPMNTTSYGLGELMKYALDQGYTQLLIGLGGSVVNDGGIGMLTALGARFYDADGYTLEGYGRDLLLVDQVDFSNLDSRLKKSEIRVATDVDNPLTGTNGATYVFGPQKGASKLMVQQLDDAMHSYSSLVEDEIKGSFQYRPGAGAAGGLGFALMAIGAELKSGASLIASTIGLEQAISTSELVITGEGKSDEQTLSGKAPSYVAQLSQHHQVICVLISGAIDDPEGKLRDGFSGVFSTIQKPMTEADSMANVSDLLYHQTANIVHFYQNFSK
ncbi:glycerate kinase [Alkalibacillus almallahensis]|uniref:glycerate kinase n=1 Tax=Alkalibacillus almallahensis TaxID=1379154 RepID=UPI00141DD131|nr:glycerate kinase [Alkalibacillus almallahensis]NIK13252.1 glycerate kinase [Alkalibacillus almallahensis]